jgi:hypothetical protein
MRDDFTTRQKEVLGRRAGLRCSNPKCRVTTSGPQNDPERAISVGVAAHISAASPGGPRYDESISSKGRRSLANAIWLCQNCAKLVDDDPSQYSATRLHQWKRDAEKAALKALAKVSKGAAEHLTEEAIRACDPNDLRFSEVEVKLSDSFESFRTWLLKGLSGARILRIEEDNSRNADFHCSGKLGRLQYPIVVTFTKSRSKFARNIDLIQDWLHPLVLKSAPKGVGIPWDTWLFPIENSNKDIKRLRAKDFDLRDCLYGVLFVAKTA